MARALIPIAATVASVAVSYGWYGIGVFFALLCADCIASDAISKIGKAE